MSRAITVGLAGVSHYQDAISQLNVDDDVTVAAEPDNAHDADAIVVVDGSGRTLGYVPRGAAQRAVRAFGLPLQARVSELLGGNGRRETVGVRVAVADPRVTVARTLSGRYLGVVTADERTHVLVDTERGPARYPRHAVQLCDEAPEPAEVA